jgi:hypothetical protein
MVSKKEALQGVALFAGATLLNQEKVTGKTATTEGKFTYYLNTSIISNQKVGFLKKFEKDKTGGC